MSHFYGTLQGHGKDKTSCGHAATGLVTKAASHRGCIVVRLWHDEAADEDRFSVCQEPWCFAGISEPIASGVLGQPAPQTREEL